MFLKDKNVLVAGGTGMIGMQLVEMLIENGASVRISSLDESYRAHPRAEFLKRDLTIYENCVEVCSDMDYVFNLLGVKASPGVTMGKPASFMYPTVMMEMNMLEAARRKKVYGYLLTSSIGVYSPAEILKEDDVHRTLPSPKDWFGGWSKRIGEIQIEAYRKEYRWDQLKIVRPANVYGPYDNFDGENAMVVPSLIKKAVLGTNPLTVWGDGRAVRDFIHSRDVAKAMIMVAEKGDYQPVNIGSGKGVSIKDLVEIIISNLDFKPIVKWEKDKPVGDSIRIMDVERLRKIGFESDINIEEGISEVMKWYKENKSITSKRCDVYKIA